MKTLWWLFGSATVLVGAVVVALLVPTPATAPAPASSPAATTSVAITLNSTDQFLADLHAANLPILVNDTYTEEVAAKAPCSVAAEGLPWSDILALDEQLPVGPDEYGQMAAIGIQDECPRYLSAVPSGWFSSN